MRVRLKPWRRALAVALVLLPGVASARDRDRDRVPDNDDHCPDQPGSAYASAPGCPDEPEPPPPPPAPVGPQVDLSQYPEPAPTPIGAGAVEPDAAGSCEGGVMEAEGGGAPPAPGTWWTFSFSCRVGAWLKFKGPLDAPLPPEVNVRAVGRLTWDSTAHMLWFDVPDGAGGRRRVSPMPAVQRPPPAGPPPSVAPSPPPAQRSSRTAGPGWHEFVCPGVFGGVSPASGLGATLTFTCDGEAAIAHRFPADHYVPPGMPGPGARGTLRFVEVGPPGTTPWTEWSSLELSGGARFAPESLYQQLLRESGEQ